MQKQGDFSYCIEQGGMNWRSGVRRAIFGSNTSVKIWKSFNPSGLHIFTCMIKDGLASRAVWSTALVPVHELFVTGTQ